MIKINYYKTTKDKIFKAFCMLAEKCYHNQMILFVYTNNYQSQIELDKTLWAYSKKQFIPHGTIHDTYQEKQPILIGCEYKNSNNAPNLIIFNATENQILTIFYSNHNCERIFFMYDEENIITDIQIKNILSKSAFSEFQFESYIQETNNNWIKIKN